MSTHYSLAQQTTSLHAQAEHWAEALANWTKKRGNKKKIPVLCYSGMSGVASATALSLMLSIHYPKMKFVMAYVRKENEKSHGSTIEHNMWEVFGSKDGARLEEDKLFPIFVDDFVSGGTTRRYTMRKVYEYFVDSSKGFGIKIGQLAEHINADVYSFIPTIEINYDVKDNFEERLTKHA